MSDLRIYKFLYGPQGPMVGVLARDQERAKELAIAFLKTIDPDDDPDAPESWLNASDVEVIEIIEERVICSA